ncbi:MAG: VanZ family protein [Candidatus Omnitrophota bacterium]|nr:VanZ family protein [Candidatus Omnitrophota bacterium]
MKYLFSWRVLGVYTFFIVLLSVFPFKEGSEVGIAFLDKIVHFCMYAGLAFLVVNTFFLKKRRRFKMSAFFYVFLLGVALEFVQVFLPYRGFELADIGCNFLGGLIGVLFVVGDGGACPVNIIKS